MCYIFHSDFVLRNNLRLVKGKPDMFVARKDERHRLVDAYESDRSHLVAIYGRMRVGKTFLVRETFGYTFTFRHAGLANLESCGFIRKYLPFGRSTKGALWQLTDHFTLSALRFLRGRVTNESYWSNTCNTPARNAWCGIAFERVCLAHVPQIKAALGVSGVASNVSSWTCRADPDKGIFGSQIDLLIDRRDQVINLCEMKYSIGEYAITKSVDEGIRHKVSDLQLATKTKSSIHVTLVTPYGLKENSYSCSIQAVITGDDLFRK